MTASASTTPAGLPTDDARLSEILDEFAWLEDWEARYAHVIGLGRDLPPLPDEERVEAAKVRGCASQVWLVSELGPDGHLHFRGQSDAAIVQGLLAILLRLYSDRSPAEIVALDAPAVFKRLGLDEALSPQRSNGLASMAARIQAVAREHL
jgi:cysteine desulfuration protein SufE